MDTFFCPPPVYIYTVKPLLNGHLWDSSRCPLDRDWNSRGVRMMLQVFYRLWFYCKTINTALFDLNMSSFNWLKNKFKKETFDVLN